MSNIGKFLEPFSYQKDFKDFMVNLENKYGKDVFNLSGIGEQLDISKMSKKFFKAKATADASVDGNANVSDKSVISHKIETAKPLQLINSFYRIWKDLKKSRGKEYAESIVESQINGRIYINDFIGISSAMPYCFNYSSYDTALMGIPSEFDGRGGSKPPKNLMSFFGQQELFSLIAGNSTVGATGLADFLIVASIYMDKLLETGYDAHFKIMEDCELYDENHSNEWQYFESLLTGFIYRLNQPYRGSQSLFSNVSVYDKYFLENMIDSYKLEIDGAEYSAKIEIVQKIQDIYLNIMNNEMSRKPLTFPVTTACFSVDEDNNILDLEFADYIAEKNLKFGFINIYSGKSSTLSSCCRLRSESDNEYFNSFGSGSTKIGSLGVCTGNLPQLSFNIVERFKNTGLENNIEEYKLEFLKELKQLVIDCQEVNNAKRNIVNKTIKVGAHPLYSLGYMDIKKQYSTFGVVGLYECLEIIGLDIMTEEGQKFVLDILGVINETNKELQKRFKSPHNCEQIPAENVAVKLSKKDKVLGINNEYILYSNQFIPLVKRVNMLDRIYLQGKFDKHFSGGAIAHINFDQEISDKDFMKNLIISCAKQGVVYFAINYILQECENGHMSVGNVDNCPICQGKITGRFTRVVGFLTKVENWIEERRQKDFPNRQFYGEV